MQQFQSYYPNSYTGYQQFPQQYQYQNNVQSAGIYGKVVDSIEVVKATDVPMNGQTYFFPRADGTEIYAKCWNQDGTTRILTYKPFFEAEPTNNTRQEEKSNDEVINRLDEAIERLSALEKIITTKNSKAKKE